MPRDALLPAPAHPASCLFCRAAATAATWVPGARLGCLLNNACWLRRLCPYLRLRLLGDCRPALLLPAHWLCCRTWYLLPLPGVTSRGYLTPLGLLPGCRTAVLLTLPATACCLPLPGSCHSGWDLPASCTWDAILHWVPAACCTILTATYLTGLPLCHDTMLWVLSAWEVLLPVSATSSPASYHSRLTGGSAHLPGRPPHHSRCLSPHLGEVPAGHLLDLTYRSCSATSGFLGDLHLFLPATSPLCSYLPHLPAASFDTILDFYLPASLPATHTSLPPLLPACRFWDGDFSHLGPGICHGRFLPACYPPASCILQFSPTSPGFSWLGGGGGGPGMPACDASLLIPLTPALPATSHCTCLGRRACTSSLLFPACRFWAHTAWEATASPGRISTYCSPQPGSLSRSGSVHCLLLPAQIPALSSATTGISA